MKKDKKSIDDFNHKCAIFLGGSSFLLNLMFHTDWILIHQILSEIKEIKSNAKDSFLTELLHFTRNNKNIFDLGILANKEDVCRYISEFIDWYNECKSNSIV